MRGAPDAPSSKAFPEIPIDRGENGRFSRKHVLAISRREIDKAITPLRYDWWPAAFLNTRIAERRNSAARPSPTNKSGQPELVSQTAPAAMKTAVFEAISLREHSQAHVHVFRAVLPENRQAHAIGRQSDEAALLGKALARAFVSRLVTVLRFARGRMAFVHRFVHRRSGH